MNRLVIMRHAKAEPALRGQDDHDRPLAERGRREALQVARALARSGIRPDHALVSSALRTRQTWEEASHAFGDVQVEIRPDLYNADADVLRHAAEAMEDSAGCLMIVAHNPGVHDLVLALAIETSASGAALDRLQRGFPTGTAAVFQIDPYGRFSFEGLLLAADLAGDE